MSDQFTQFHYKVSRSTYLPDYEADDFDVKDIYVHSTMKVSRCIKRSHPKICTALEKPNVNILRQNVPGAA